MKRTKLIFSKWLKNDPFDFLETDILKIEINYLYSTSFKSKQVSLLNATVQDTDVDHTSALRKVRPDSIQLANLSLSF